MSIIMFSQFSIIFTATLVFSFTSLATAQLPSCVSDCVQTYSDVGVEALCQDSTLSCIAALCPSNSTTDYSSSITSLCELFSTPTTNSSNATVTVTSTSYVCGASSTTESSTTTTASSSPTPSTTLLAGNATTVYPSGTGPVNGSSLIAGTVTYVSPTLSSQITESTAEITSYAVPSSAAESSYIWSTSSEATSSAATTSSAAVTTYTGAAAPIRPEGRTFKAAMGIMGAGALALVL